MGLRLQVGVLLKSGWAMVLPCGNVFSSFSKKIDFCSRQWLQRKGSGFKICGTVMEMGMINILAL